MPNQRVLITGSSGFLGNYIKNVFKEENYEVYTLGRKVQNDVKEHIIWDSSNIPTLKDVEYTKIVHISGKAHSIPKSKEELKVFYSVNLDGTSYLLESLNRLKNKPQIFIFISTVAVYGIHKGLNISEEYEAKPTTPYGDSKLKAEQIILDWCNKNSCKLVILRLPLVVGENPPGNLGNMKFAIARGTYPRIRNNRARKSAVLANDVATLVERLKEQHGTYNLTDGVHPSFEDIENAIQIRLNTEIRISIPLLGVKILATIGDILQKTINKEMPISSNRLEKITSNLTFDDTKARDQLGWKPNPVLPFIEKHL